MFLGKWFEFAHYKWYKFIFCILSISLNCLCDSKEHKSSNIINIKSKKDSKIENNKTIYQQRKQNRWPKRNVPRSVVEQHEPNGYMTNELDKSSSIDEVEKNTITSKRNRRHVAHSRHPSMSHKMSYKVTMFYYFSYFYWRK